MQQSYKCQFVLKEEQPKSTRNIIIFYLSLNSRFLCDAQEKHIVTTRRWLWRCIRKLLFFVKPHHNMILPQKCNIFNFLRNFSIPSVFWMCRHLNSQNRRPTDRQTDPTEILHSFYVIWCGSIRYRHHIRRDLPQHSRSFYRCNRHFIILNELMAYDTNASDAWYSSPWTKVSTLKALKVHLYEYIPFDVYCTIYEKDFLFMFKSKGRRIQAKSKLERI